MDFLSWWGKIALFAATMAILISLLLPVGAYAAVHRQTGDGGQIAFVSDVSGNPEIYVINADGTSLMKLTVNATEDWHPSWSPGGDKIVFQSMTDGVFNIYVMRSDGSELTRLTYWTPNETGGRAGVQRPVWSPDGSRIAASFEGERTWLFVMNADASNLVTLAEGRDPAWSPDGTRIAFDQQGNIWVINADGTNLRQLTYDPTPKLYPAWSPDGSQIAYTTLTSEGGAIYIMNADGSNVRQLTNKSAYGLSWSPDGREIVFGSEGWVWIINTDGTGLKNVVQGYQPAWSPRTQPSFPPLTPPYQPPQPLVLPSQGPLSGKIAFAVFNPSYGKYDTYVARPDGSERGLVADQMRQPALSPDGKRLSVNGDKHVRMHLFVMNADGTNQVEVTLHIEDGQPSWSPEGGRIVFSSTMVPDRKPRLYILDQIPGDERGRQDGRTLSYGAKEVTGRHPCWMPDGRIIYTGCDDWATGGSCGLMIIPPEGGIATQITYDANDTAPDVYGNRVVFMSLRGGNWDIYTVNLDGSGLMRLTDNGLVNDGLPVWSPDGSTIAFVSDEGGVWAIWAMNPDGSNRRKLFNLDGGYGEGEYDWTTERISWEP